MSQTLDEHLQENEKVERAIAALLQEPTQEMLAHVLTVLRRQMNDGGQLVVAVDASKGKNVEDDKFLMRNSLLYSIIIVIFSRMYVEK